MTRDVRARIIVSRWPKWVLDIVGEDLPPVVVRRLNRMLQCSHSHYGRHCPRTVWEGTRYHCCGDHEAEIEDRYGDYLSEEQENQQRAINRRNLKRRAEWLLKLYYRGRLTEQLRAPQHTA